MTTPDSPLLAGTGPTERCASSVGCHLCTRTEGCRRATHLYSQPEAWPGANTSTLHLGAGMAA
ncbi:hypothetical protein ACFFQF_20385 [Haladaptatus pallidirubidus]|uniref:hypothetical protein n=1 Tax=Haladaptatus pallidirubidus TaxID=1008152 RepID=UPI0031E94DBF